MRSGITRSKEFNSITTKDNHTDGDAPLPWPVPKRGSKVVPLYCIVILVFFAELDYTPKVCFH